MNQLENPIEWESDTNCWSSVIASSVNALGAHLDHKFTGSEIAHLLGNKYSASELLINTAIIFNRELSTHRIDYAVGVTYATREAIRELLLDGTNQGHLLSLPVHGDKWVRQVLGVQNLKEPISDHHAVLAYSSDISANTSIIHIMDPASEKIRILTFDDLIATCLVHESSWDMEEQLYIYGILSQTPAGSEPSRGVHFSGPQDLLMKMVQMSNVTDYEIVQYRKTGL